MNRLRVFETHGRAVRMMVDDDGTEVVVVVCVATTTDLAGQIARALNHAEADLIEDEWHRDRAGRWKTEDQPQ